MRLPLSRIAMGLGCLALSACAAPSTPEPEPEPMTTSASEKTATPETPVATDKPDASITGAIRIGTRAAPTMRVCAMAVSGADHHCVPTTGGAMQYRIDNIPAGRYHLVGWVRDDRLKLVAHADIVRCVRAPCPPDQLREVSVAAGQAVTGIDLSASYTEVPKGWPSEPVD